MYSVHSSQKRGLLRPHSMSSSGPIFRNLPLFGFLAGLVLFFFIFYVYQAQNTELAMMREQIELERSQHARSKAENIDLRAQMEKYKSTENDLKNELHSAQMTKEECDANLKKEAYKVQTYAMDMEKLRQEKSMCSNSLASINSQMTQTNLTHRAKLTSLESQIEMQKKIIESLHAQLQGKVPQSNILPGIPNVEKSPPNAAAVVPQNAFETAKQGITSVPSGSVTAKSAVESPLKEQIVNLVEQTKDANANILGIAPAPTPGEEGAAKQAQVENLQITTVAALPKNEDNEAHVLEPPPAQPDKRLNETGGNDVGKAEALNLNGPADLGKILALNRGVGPVQEKDDLKNAGEGVDGKKVVGGAYDDSIMTGDKRAEAPPEFEDDAGKV